MSCKGLHCDGCPGGSGGAAAAVIALLVIIAVGLRKAWPSIVHVAEITAWTVAALAGAILVITGSVVAVRVTRRLRARRAARQVSYQATVLPAARLTARPIPGQPAGRPALGPPPRRQLGAWPLPGWWEEIRPRIGSDGDDRSR